MAVNVITSKVDVVMCVILSKAAKHVPYGELLGRLCLKRDGTRAETRFRLLLKRMSPFKSVGASVQSTTGSRGVCISGSNAGCTVFWGSVKSTGYPLNSPVSPSLPLPWVTVCHQVSNAVYHWMYDVTRCLTNRYGYHWVQLCVCVLIVSAFIWN
jgi:hypothetical protein